MKNTKIENLKWDILADFQTLWLSYDLDNQNYQLEREGIVNKGKMEIRNKLSNVAKPHKTSTKDRFNLTSLWFRTTMVKVLPTSPTKEMGGIMIPSTTYRTLSICISTKVEQQEEAFEGSLLTFNDSLEQRKNRENRLSEMFPSEQIPSKNSFKT